MKKLLIVVDYQKDFVNGALPCGAAAEALEERICRKIAAYRAAGDGVLFLKDTHLAAEYQNTREAASFPPHCLKGTPGWELYGKVREMVGDSPVLEKPSFGAKQQPELDLVKQAEEYEVVGVATNVCVLHNVVILYNFFKDKPISVDAQCCASFDRRLHDNAIELMRGFGVTIL